MVPRKIMDRVPAELYYSFPLEQPNGEKITISPDGKKAIFPMYKLIQAGCKCTPLSVSPRELYILCNCEWQLSP